jgi:hypothetical protein
MRLSDEADINLLAQTNCKELPYSPATVKQATRIQNVVELNAFIMPTQSTYSRSTQLSKLGLTGTSEMGRK